MTIQVTTDRHPGNTINAVFHDGHAKNFKVRDLYNPDNGGPSGVTAAGNTEMGRKFWGLDQDLTQASFAQNGP